MLEHKHTHDVMSFVTFIHSVTNHLVFLHHVVQLVGKAHGLK